MSAEKNKTQRIVDANIVPGDDFYGYVCNNWMQENPLPKAYASYGSFTKLVEENEQKLYAIFDGLAKEKLEDGSVEQKLRDLYALGMDMEQRNRDGRLEVIDILNDIERAQTIEELSQIQYKYAFFDLGFPLAMYFGGDDKNSAMNILCIEQGGLSLPEREYYLSEDETMKKQREEFKKHLVNMFKLFQFSEEEAQNKMNLIFDWEAECAKISRTKEELIDPIKNYNKISLQEFQEKYPHIPLVKLFAAKGIFKRCFEELVVRQPEFLENINKMMGEQSVEVLRARLQWDIISLAAKYLDDETIEENFNFWGKILVGKEEQHPLKKRVLNQLEGLCSNAIGKMFCEKYFPASSKNQMLTLVDYLRQAFAERIKAQTWMSDKTKEAALEKLASFRVKIGYPNKWDDFSAWKVDKEKTYFSNILATAEFRAKYYLQRRAGKPVDKEEWLMSPHMVNAYYMPTTNEICFPAGILQSPFFDPDSDDAENFGAIGAVIGHEMTHGFDNQGHLYDKDGNLNPWWTEEDEKAFKEKTAKFEEFFSQIKIFPDLNANGTLTLG